MFTNEKVNVPVLGLVENMAWFTPAELPENKYYLFGKEGGKRLSEELNIALLGQIPIVQSICEGGDNGKPVALDPQSITGMAFCRFSSFCRRSYRYSKQDTKTDSNRRDPQNRKTIREYLHYIVIDFALSACNRERAKSILTLKKRSKFSPAILFLFHILRIIHHIRKERIKTILKIIIVIDKISLQFIYIERHTPILYHNSDRLHQSFYGTITAQSISKYKMPHKTTGYEQANKNNSKLNQNKIFGKRGQGN